MSLTKINILGVGVTSSDKTEILEQIKNYLGKDANVKPLTIFTPNPEQVVLANEDEEFRKLLNSADVSLPDGAGIIWALKMQNAKIPSASLRAGKMQNLSDIERIPGIEFMEALIKVAAEKGYQVGLIGGRDGVAQKALVKVQKKYPKLKGWVEDGGEFRIKSLELRIMGEDNKNYFRRVAKRVHETRTKLVFVGLGAPKQEYFITELSKQFAVRSSQKKTTAYYLLPAAYSLVIMAVGGAFDIFSRKIPRAPKFVQGLQLEWLWRLAQEPQRIFRQIKLVKFFILTLRRRFVLQ